MEIQRTLFIWNQYEYGLKYFLVDGDYRHLNGVFIGQVGKEAEQDELVKLTEEADGSSIQMLEEFPIDEVYESEQYSIAVIEAGMFP